jgi:hypothetical protein
MPSPSQVNSPASPAGARRAARRPAARPSSPVSSSRGGRSLTPAPRRRVATSQLHSALLRGSLLQLHGLHTSSWLSAVNIVCPPMGDSVSEGSIAAVLKQPGGGVGDGDGCPAPRRPNPPARPAPTASHAPAAGDAVKEDDVIAQIETDKVTIDVKYTARTPGTISALLIKEGDTVVVGQDIAKVEEGAAAAPAAAPAAAAEAPKPAAEPPKPAAAAPPPPPKPAAAPEKVRRAAAGAHRWPGGCRLCRAAAALQAARLPGGQVAAAGRAAPRRCNAGPAPACRSA